MKASSQPQSGSHIIGLALGLLFVGVVVFAGYRVWQMQQAAVSSQDQSSTTVPAAIKTTAALDQTSTALDQASAQLNASLDDSQLNSDLNSML